MTISTQCKRGWGAHQVIQLAFQAFLVACEDLLDTVCGALVMEKLIKKSMSLSTKREDKDETTKNLPRLQDT